MSHGWRIFVFNLILISSLCPIASILLHIVECDCHTCSTSWSGDEERIRVVGRTQLTLQITISGGRNRWKLSPRNSATHLVLVFHHDWDDDDALKGHRDLLKLFHPFEGVFASSVALSVGLLLRLWLVGIDMRMEFVVGECSMLLCESSWIRRLKIDWKLFWSTYNWSSVS